MGRGSRGGLGALAAALLLVAPALADTDLGGSGGEYYETDSGAIGPPGYALELDVECPGSTHPTGGGFASSYLTIQSFPLGGGDVWRVYAYDGSGSGHLDAFAMCKAGNLRYPSRYVPVEAGKAKAARVACPDGTHVVGGGGWLGAAPSQGWLNSSYPYDGHDPGHTPDDGWRVRVDDAYAGDTNMRVVAVCQRRRVHYVHESVDLIPSQSSAAIPACQPADHVIGAGIELSGAASTGVPRVLKPSDGTDGNNVPDDKVLANAENLPGASGNKTLTGWAICEK